MMNEVASEESFVEWAMKKVPSGGGENGGGAKGINNKWKARDCVNNRRRYFAETG